MGHAWCFLEAVDNEENGLLEIKWLTTKSPDWENNLLGGFLATMNQKDTKILKCHKVDQVCRREHHSMSDLHGVCCDQLIEGTNKIFFLPLQCWHFYLGNLVECQNQDRGTYRRFQPSWPLRFFERGQWWGFVWGFCCSTGRALEAIRSACVRKVTVTGWVRHGRVMLEH